jgi:methionyl-tRNA synthetase
METDAVMQYLLNNYWLLGLLAAWTVFWKAVALWHAARNRQATWYIVLWIINTLGLLEIIYLFFFRRKRHESIYMDDFKF